MAKKPVTSTILRVYLLEKSRPGKEEGMIMIDNSPGDFNKVQAHFDSLDDMPQKIRQLLKDAGIEWPRGQTSN